MMRKFGILFIALGRPGTISIIVRDKKKSVILESYREYTIVYSDEIIWQNNFPKF